jgi:hypothetical protein
MMPRPTCSFTGAQDSLSTWSYQPISELQPNPVVRLTKKLDVIAKLIAKPPLTHVPRPAKLECCHCLLQIRVFNLTNAFCFDISLHVAKTVEAMDHSFEQHMDRHGIEPHGEEPIDAPVWMKFMKPLLVDHDRYDPEWEGSDHHFQRVHRLKMPLAISPEVAGAGPFPKIHLVDIARLPKVLGLPCQDFALDRGHVLVADDHGRSSE